MSTGRRSCGWSSHRTISTTTTIVPGPVVACVGGERPRPLLPGDEPLVRVDLRRAHARTGPRMAGHQRGPARPDPGPDRFGQDPRRLLVDAGPADHHAATGGRQAPLPRALRLAAEGPHLRRR